MHEVYLSLGTNLGHREENLQEAIRRINGKVGAVVAQSAFMDTEPWGYQSSRHYLNACVRVATEMSPRAILRATQLIERQMGRRHKTQNGVYRDRIIDIDILLYDDVSIDEPDLKIPHPRMLERDFVMQPLREIMPDGQL